MKKPKRETDSKSVVGKPTMLVGAGKLVAAIWKRSNKSAYGQYRFIIRRKSDVDFLRTEKLLPLDIVSLVKLTRILATVILDDGCLSETERTVLKAAKSQLDALYEVSGETSCDEA